MSADPDRSSRPRSPIDRAALLDRLGDADPPPAEPHAWLSRASMADRLPELVGLDQRSSYAVCVEVVRHLRPGARR